MVEETTLSVSIDASAAKQGAAEFRRAADDIKKRAAEIDRSVGRSSGAFKDMRTEVDQVRNISGLYEEQIKSLNQRIESIDRSLEASRSTSIVASFLKQPLGPAVTLFINESQKSLEEERKKLEREKQIIAEDTLAKDFIGIANTAVNPDIRKRGEKRAVGRLKNAQALEETNIAPTLEREQAAVNNVERFRRDTGEDPFIVGPDEASFASKFVLEGLRAIEKELEEPRAKMEARGEAIAFLELPTPPEVSPESKVLPVNKLTPNNSMPGSDLDDSGPGRLIEDTNRNIELLKEQKELIEEGTTTLSEQKALEAETRERILVLGDKESGQKTGELERLSLEKDGLDQVNKSLEAQAALRERTEDDTDKLNARAAALEDLAQKLDGSGLSAAEMQVEIDLLNSAIAAGVDVTKQWGQEWLEAQRKLKTAEKSVQDMSETQRKLEQDAEDARKKADEDMRRRAEAVEDVFGDIRDAAKDSIKDVIKGTESIGDAFQKLADRITDILLDLALEELLSGGTGFSDVFGTILGGIGGIGGTSGGGADPLGLLTTAAFGGGVVPFHKGGVVGFDGTPRFHTGGIAGLRPDEVPAVLQRGEEVLTANDPRHRDNGGSAGNVVVNVTFPNARNTDEARQAGSEIAAKAAAAAQRGMARKGIG